MSESTIEKEHVPSDPKKPLVVVTIQMKVDVAEPTDALERRAPVALRPLTRDEILEVLGGHHGREADALIVGAPDDVIAPLSPAIFNILSARFSDSLVIDRWRVYGGFKKVGEIQHRRGLTWGLLREFVGEFLVRHRARAAAGRSSERSTSPEAQP